MGDAVYMTDSFNPQLVVIPQWIVAKNGAARRGAVGTATPSEFQGEYLTRKFAAFHTRLRQIAPGPGHLTNSARK
jgi:hypothetical protein